MTSLRAGLVGLGMMGRHHARVLGSLPGVDLVAVADPSGDRLGVSGGRRVVADIDELLDLGLDYCVVAVPTADHLQVALRLAEAGVHALVEKPLADTAEAAQQMVGAFLDPGLIGAVGHIERFNPALQQARARIAAGDLGAIYQVATRRQGPFPARVADVGVVKDLATHDIDLTQWVTQCRYVRIAANTANRSGREHEDLVAASGLLDGGVVANHLVNWLSPLKERTTVITGEKGTLQADTLNADLTFFANGTVPTEWADVRHFRGVTEGDVTRFAFAKPEPLVTEHEHFRDALLGRPATIVTFEQGAATVRIAEACVESARTGRALALGSD